MWVDEWESVLESALTDLERCVRLQQQGWRQDRENWQQQLTQAQQREAELCAQIEKLVIQLNSMDESPERNPLVQRIKMIGAYIDALAKDASAFSRSLP
ncbi:MAG: hypothetical protein ACR5LF_07655 [Symbiopectobacterium sp.]|uniref:hypothetical protein n=1 Tax=Symbiopectobacterium sp. TaxID=2952789 RepID=UPI003F3509C9